MKVAVIIVNYNDVDDTEKYVNTITKYESINRIVVVDNMSTTQGTFETLKKLEYDKKIIYTERTNGKFVTDEKIPVVAVEKTYDFDAMMVKVQALISDLMTKNQTNAVKITAVIDKYLGKGKKVSECTSSQCEQLELIIQDLEDLV